MARPFKPEGWPTLAPRIITDDVAGLAAFLKHVFGAEGDVHPGRPAEMRIDDSVILLSDGGGARAPTAAMIYVYVADTDTAFQRAMAKGAESIEAPSDMPYGDRRAVARDAWGNIWQIATRL